MAAAYLGLGSNQGDRLRLLQAAADRLDASTGVRVVRSSRVYETRPVGGPAQPDFLNAVIEVATELEPVELLHACQRVEAALGRTREVRWGPRTIDIDVLGFDERRIDEPELVVPHPRMHQRAFVLAPLLELDADPPLPGGRAIRSLRLPPGELAGVRVVAPPLSVRSDDRRRSEAAGR
jgi:2-amino-4-hydroxy-6-hydroxymethyldihydropteridine diphosphokinase